MRSGRGWASRHGLALGVATIVGLACGGAKTTVATLPPAVTASSPPPPIAPPPPSRAPTKAADLCALARGAVGEALPGAHAFTREDPPQDGTDDMFTDRAKRAPAGDSCFVSDDNLARLEHGVGSSRTAATNDARGVTPVATPRYLDRIAAHLHLNDGERAALDRNGFVALDRVEYESYATAYHDVFQQELPVFVSIDSVLNSVFQSNGSILEHVEATDLQPRLVRMLRRLQRTLATSVPRYGAETAHDVDVYLGVATSLLGDGVTPALPASVLHHEGEVAELASKGLGEGGLAKMTVFGRDRVIDFSQLTPRGHYADHNGTMTQTPPLDGYFRAMMWLSRFEWNLSSRSCRSSAPDVVDPSETPREARDAMAVADLVARAGALDDLRAFDRVYTVFAGRREDVSVSDLLRLMSTARIAGSELTHVSAPERLRAAIGTGFQRTARVHFMPEGSTALPVIATLFGPRIVPDTAPLTHVVHDSVPDRKWIGAADVGFILGHDRAGEYLKKDLTTFPTLHDALTGARAELRHGLEGKTDLYSLWLTAVVRLADTADARATTPSFLRTQAYRDMSLNSAVVGYGQIRHNYVLVAAQGYDSYGCEIPDGYVEPALGTYDALLAYARAARAMGATDAASRAYWKRVIEVLGMLRGIVVTELSGARLSEGQRRWLGMVSEYIPTGGYADSGAPPKWTGWYFDLFPDRHHSAERTPAFVADYFTLTNLGEVAYVGAERPRMGVFVIDVNGEPRAMVGPVAKGYELSAPLSTRLDDAKGLALAPSEKRAPWLSYLAPDVPLPELEMSHATCGGDEERVALSATRPVGDVTVTLLDHHGDPMTEPLTATVGETPTLFTFHLGPALVAASHAIEGMHVHVHDLAPSGLGHGSADVTYGGRVYTNDGTFGAGPPLRHPFRPFDDPSRFGPGALPFPPLPASPADAPP